MQTAEDIEEKIIEPARRLLEPLPSLIHINGETMVIGDLHGDLRAAKSAIDIFKARGLDHILFLGDYVDRGKECLPLLELILCAMVEDPAHVHLLRGNHETLWVNEEHGFRDELEKRGLLELHLKFNELFSYLPVVAILGSTVFAVHGGLPQEMPTLDQIKSIRKGFLNPDEVKDRMFLGLVWNDPTDGTLGFGRNDYRGYMRTFGSRVFKEFCDKNGIESLIRGHQRWPDGYRYFFEEKLLSVFSCSSYSPNVRTKAAIVEGTAFKLVDI